jgi:hypothetical protein
MDCMLLDTSTGIPSSAIVVGAGMTKDNKGATTIGMPTPKVPLTKAPNKKTTAPNATSSHCDISKSGINWSHAFANMPSQLN